MTRQAQSERLLLCDDLERLGPDAPTLCEGWLTRDLAAHLVIRDSRPDLFAGLFVPFLSGRLDREMRRFADGDYPALVEQVRSGAPVWNVAAQPLLDDLTNLIEFFVHHEDVRRAQPEWTVRHCGEDLESALWTALRRFARLARRPPPTGILQTAVGRRRHAGTPPDDHGTVVVRGAVPELVLFANRRGRVADVTFSGDADDVAALTAWAH
jgi:uncharacterized protein (TIGR03085 family)